mgnify:CR=1 FL=1
MVVSTLEASVMFFEGWEAHIPAFLTASAIESASSDASYQKRWRSAEWTS